MLCRVDFRKFKVKYVEAEDVDHFIILISTKTNIRYANSSLRAELIFDSALN